MILGNRIPYEYFITKGKGESDDGSEFLPFKVNSFDNALIDAGLKNPNIIEYTSVMPPEAIQITKEEGIKRLKWGEVLECIKAQSNGNKGEQISSAVIITTIIDPSGKYLGGLACEYAGTQNKFEVEKYFLNAIHEMIQKRGFGEIKDGIKMFTDNITEFGYIVHPGKIFEYESLIATKKFASVITAICFVSHIYPVIE